MANVLKQIYDELVSIIKTQYPRFQMPGRIEVSEKVKLANLGYEDCLVIRPLPMIPAVNLTSGKIVQYQLRLLYYKKLHENEIDNISDFAEDLDNYLTANYVHHNGYWLNLGIEIDYDTEAPEFGVPEKYEGKLSGFIMTLTMTRYKS